MDCMESNEILKYAIENGIINVDTLHSQMEMSKRKSYLEQHPYKVWFGTDGFWHTYLPKGDGRQAVKRKNKASIENAIIQYWENNSSYHFKECFNAWIERQKVCGRSANTVYKYKTDYKRFFENYPIEHMNICDITDSVLGAHILATLKEKPITYKALKGIFGYVNGMFDKCVKDKLIKPENNPCLYIDLPLYRQYCVQNKVKSAAERTLSDTEMRALKRNINITTFKKPNYIPQYAVELSMYTGMRAGELSALRWEDIDFKSNSITICRSEKHNRESGEYFIASTKNYLVRVYPITPDISKILNTVKEIELNNGWLGEFVFMNEKGRIHACAISSCAKRKTSTKEFYNTKSVHAIRRTVNSRLRCMGVSATVASSLLGHTEEVNNKNYTYDITPLETKSGYVKQATSIL